ncbi:MAG: DUF4358 domain-containing protein [Candidatus Gastranaerophilales bacterium]|nr:DUF4358 domain-containing protein [Candidatus Gastranaerophilales bacterium]
MKKIGAVLILGMLLFPLAACADGAGPTTGQVSGEDQESADLEQIRDAVAVVLEEDYWPDTQVTPDLLEGIYGISSELYENYLAEVCMISANVDTLLIIEAKSDKVEEVEKILHSYHDSQVNEVRQYPMNIGKVQASRVESIGNYVCFVQLGADAVDEEDTDTAIELCRDQNELVIEIIRQKIQSE